MSAIAPAQNLSELQSWAKWLGRLFTVLAAIMTFWFGYQYSLLIGVGFAAVTVMVSILLNFVDIAWKSGFRNVAVGVGCFWLIAVIVELGSHVGFTVFHRTDDVVQATLQDTRYEDGRQNIADLQAKKAMLEKRLGDLEATKGWSAAKPSKAYDEEIAAQRLAVDLEASRGGCKAKCLEEKRKLAELEANRATAVAHETDSAMLAATIEGLKNTREKEATVHKGESAVLTQQKMFAQIATFNLAPDATAVAWAGYAIGAVMSIIFSFAATVCNFLGFKDWSNTLRAKAGLPPLAEDAAEKNPLQPQIDELKAILLQMAQASQRVGQAPQVPVSAPATAAPVREHHTEREVLLVPDDEFRDRVVAAARRARAQLRAA